MAARYGRNKRRAAREAIAAAELGRDRAIAQRDRTLEDLSVAIREKNSLQATLNELQWRIHRAVGPRNSMMPLALQERAIGRPPRNMPMPSDPGTVPARRAALGDEVVVFDRVRLMALVAKVERMPMSFSHLVRFMSVDEDSGPRGFPEFYYVISREALHCHGLEHEAQTIADMVVRVVRACIDEDARS